MTDKARAALVPPVIIFVYLCSLNKKHVLEIP
jgi:hypothetical protein